MVFMCTSGVHEFDSFFLLVYLWFWNDGDINPTTVLPRGLEDVDDSLIHMCSIHSAFNSLIRSLHMKLVTKSCLCVPLCCLLLLLLIRLILEVDV